MTAIKVKDFESAFVQLEYMEDWDFVESESGDMRFDTGNWSIWLRQGSEVIIEGVMPERIQRKIIREIEDAEIY